MPQGQSAPPTWHSVEQTPSPLLKATQSALSQSLL
jgi:hypothetical protein